MLSDEKLMALVDGELDAAEAKAVKTALASDAVAQARLAVFRSTGKPLAQIFDHLMREPVPDRLRELIEGHAETHARQPVGRHALATEEPSFFAMFKSLFEPPQSRLPLALAFSAMFMVGAGAAWLIGLNDRFASGHHNALLHFGDDGLAAGGSLAQVLERVLSGRKMAVKDDRQQDVAIKVVLTFRNKQKNFCREYEVAKSSGQHFSGVACRVGGRWQVRAHMVAAGAAGAGGDVIKPADGANALDRVIDTMMAGDAFGADAEAAAISGGWQN